jgi:hypothetical protein
MTALVRKAGSATEPGEITLDAQVIAGAKTFNASMTLGIASNTPYDSYHTTNKNIFSAPTAGTSSSGAFAIGANAYYGSGRQPTRQVGTGGYLIALDNSTADGNFSFFVRANLAADSATTGAVNILQASQTGRFTFGRNDTANLSTVYQHTFISAGQTQLDITATGNAAGTGGSANIRLRATGERGGSLQFFRGTDGGTFDTNATIKWNWVHGGNGDLMTGGGVDSIAFYSYGIGNYMGQLCYDGRWYIGPDSGYTIVHKSFGTWDHKTAASVGVGAIYRSAAALTSGQSLDAVQWYDNTTYKGGIGVAKTTNTSNQAGYIALVTNNGTVCYLWCDDTGRLRISTTQTNTGGQATGTVVGTQT